jgi:hypothetical protein
METTVSWDMTPYIQVEIHRRFEGIYRLRLSVRIITISKLDEGAKLTTLWSVGLEKFKPSSQVALLAACVVYSYTLKKEAMRFAETSLKLRHVTRSYIPEVTLRSPFARISGPTLQHNFLRTIDNP